MPNSAVFIGEPLDFKGKFKVYPPKVKEVVGEPMFGAYYKLLTVTQEDISDELLKKKKPNEEIKIPTPFEFLLINAYHEESFLEIAQKAFEFFLHQKVNFLFEEKMIIIGDLKDVVQQIKSVEELIMLTEEEYFDFQNLVREAHGDSIVKPPIPEDPNEDPRIRAIKEKARRRDRIKAKQKPSGGITLHTSLVAICCMGIGITPLNIGEMSYASISELMSMMQDKEKYDIDIRSLLAGADSKKIKPKYWIRNSDKE